MVSVWGLVAGVAAGGGAGGAPVRATSPLLCESTSITLSLFGL